jgi:oxaloacetate decarboxylase alpha subunit
MVTPLSQFVGSQAAVNVISGSRYGVVTDSSIEYALGLHGGDEAVSLMDQGVRDRILAHPRAREVAARRAEPLPTLAELRDRYGPRGPDEDLIWLAIMGDGALDIVGSFAHVRLDEPPAQDMLTTVRRSIADAHDHPVALTAPGLTLAVAGVRGPGQEA